MGPGTTTYGGTTYPSTDTTTMVMSLHTHTPYRAVGYYRAPLVYCGVVYPSTVCRRTAYMPREEIWDLRYGISRVPDSRSRTSQDPRIPVWPDLGWLR